MEEDGPLGGEDGEAGADGGAGEAQRAGRRSTPGLGTAAEAGGRFSLRPRRPAALDGDFIRLPLREQVRAGWLGGWANGVAA
jgi:hypothetical protein